MTNPFEIVASAPPDQVTPSVGTFEELEEFLRDYLKVYELPLLERHAYVHKFSNGVQQQAAMTCFPRVAVILFMPPPLAPRMTGDELRQYVKEVEARTDELFDTAEQKAGIDPANALTINGPGFVIIYQRKDNL